MKVKKLSGKVQDAQQIPTLFDNENITYHPIDIVNWKEYPYQPQVSFRIAYTNDAILVHYKVVEDSVRAKYGEDNGSVWTDSCVEFFSIPAGDGIYYNLECNCIATILLAAGSERNNRVKRRNESLDRTHAINHSAIAPKEVPAGSKLFIYQIPDKELNANSEITDKNE